MKKLLISFATIIWILHGAALCIADDFCTSSFQLDSDTVPIKSIKNEVKSSCDNTETKSVKSDSPEHKRYKYGTTVYINEELKKIHQEDLDYSITKN